MSVDENWCREKLANLQIKDLQINTLNEIKNHLTNLPMPTQEISSNFLKLPALFDCLYSGSEQSKLACDVLSICMTNLDLGEAVNNHSNLLEKSLYHQNPDVQLMALNELLKVANHSPNTSLTDTSLIIASIHLIDSTETRVGTTCIELLSKVLPNFIDIGSIRSNLEEVLKSRDIVRCRVYEIGVNLSKDSVVQEKVEFILNKLISDLDNDDVLLQLNVLELLAQLALPNHGLIYLENKGVISRLIKKIDCSETLDEYQFSQLIVPGLMKFFGNITSRHPIKVFNKYPNVVQSLFECIISNDISTMPIALDTLGCIGKSMDGKICLHSEMESKLCSILIQIGHNLHTYSTDLKIRALNSLEHLFSSDTDEPNNQISLITENWYKKMTSTNDLNFIMAFCKNSFPDIKISGLQVLQSICNYQWGQISLSITPGFIEFLLDRKIEFDKNVIHVKYEIIKVLSVSKVFDKDTLNQLKKFVSEGVFYIQTNVEVAIEGAE